MDAAGFAGDKRLIEYAVEMAEAELGLVFGGACQGNQEELIEELIKKNKVVDFREGLLRSLLGGHKHLAQKFIEKGANDFESALSVACN